jgi:hypothetical protein
VRVDAYICANQRKKGAVEQLCCSCECCSCRWAAAVTFDLLITWQLSVQGPIAGSTVEGVIVDYLYMVWHEFSAVCVNINLLQVQHEAPRRARRVRSSVQNPEPAIMFLGRMCQIALLRVLLYNQNNSKNYGGISRVRFDIAGE